MYVCMYVSVKKKKEEAVGTIEEVNEQIGDLPFLFSDKISLLSTVFCLFLS
jgi:hypothetical protein